MELDSRKKSRCDQIMRPKRFDAQDMREIGWKKTGESKDIPILWMAITEDFF